MPCYDPRDNDSDLQDENKTLISYLCTTCWLLEKENKPIPNDIQEWWRVHKFEDKKRIDKELASGRHVSSLSEYELYLIGLKVYKTDEFSLS